MEVPDIYIFHSWFLFAVLQWVIFSGVRRFLLLTNSSFTSENLSIFFFFCKALQPPESVPVADIFLPPDHRGRNTPFRGQAEVSYTSARRDLGPALSSISFSLGMHSRSQKGEILLPPSGDT